MALFADAQIPTQPVADARGRCSSLRYSWWSRAVLLTPGKVIDSQAYNRYAELISANLRRSRKAKTLSQLRPYERWAKACVEHALPDYRVEQHDWGGEKEYDLHLIGPDNSIGAMEITAAAERTEIELSQVLHSRGYGSRTARDLKGGWIVAALPSAKEKKLEKELPSLLRDLERQDRTSVRGDKTSSDELAQRAGWLSVAEAEQFSTERPGTFDVTIGSPETMHAWAPTGDPLAIWLGDFLALPTQHHNILKVSVPDAQERHLFIVVVGLSYAPPTVNYLLMTPHAPTPTVDPALPGGITHVWVMGDLSLGDGFRWAADIGWRRFAKVM